MNMMKDIDFSNVDDEMAIRIGQILAETHCSHVTEVALDLSKQLTVCGARVVAHELKQSQIKVLKIYLHSFEMNDGTGAVLQSLLEMAIQHSQKLVLNLPLNDDIAVRLSEILLLQDHGSNHHELQTLWIVVGCDLTEGAALQLSDSLRHAKVKCLELGGDRLISRNVMSTLYLAAMDSVKHLVLLDCMTNETATEIGDALIGNTTLEHLAFTTRKGTSIDAAVRLTNGIIHSHIAHLVMDGASYCSSNLPVDLQDVLYQGVARSPTIRHLTVRNGFSGTPGLTRCLSRLQMFKMDRFSMMTEDFSALMTGLRNAPHLTSLVLERQRLQKLPDILSLCEVLPHLTSLTDLTICCNLAFEEEEQQRFDVMPLDLKLRRAQATGAEQLMLAVANHPSLVRLTLSECRDFGFAGLAMIGTHLPNTKLKELHLMLSYGKYVPYDNRLPVQQAYQRACQALVAGVQSSWHLHVLTTGNVFPSEVEDKINFYLDWNRSGRSMLHDTDSEQISMGLWSHVLAKCSNKADFMYYNLREQPTLVLTAGMCHNN